MPSANNYTPPRRFSASIYWLATLVVLLAAGGLLLVLRFGDITYQRELQGWQEKLNLIADSRAQDVRQWVEDQFLLVQSLADNASLQLYMTELTSADVSTYEVEPPAEAVYLRNLLVVTAQQGGFLPTKNAENQIPANVERLANSGIAIADMQWRPIVSTEGFPPLSGAMKEQLGKLQAGQSHLLDISRPPGKELRIGFVAPVYAIQGDRDISSQIGWVIGLRPADDSLFSRLKHPGATENTLEAVLFREANGEAEYISPLRDGSAALEKRLSLTTDNLAAARALTKPGSFALARDYKFVPVLMTSRKITGTPWVLLLKISQQEALAASEQWRGRMMIILLLGVGLALMLIIAAWWYGTSKEAQDLAEKQRKLAEDYARQERLLRLVTDNEPESLFIVDADMHCHFANRRAAELAEVSTADMHGKTLASLLGPARAKCYEDACAAALETGETQTLQQQVEFVGKACILRCEFVPLHNVPVASLSSDVPGVLIVEQDITEAVQERERRERVLSQLIDTLVRLVDERDPHSANHSTAVARLAREIAHEMGLDSKLCETADMAGKLLNIGKIALPQELLTKTRKLDKQEKESIYDALTGSAYILEAIEFDGPVVKTLRQAREHFDGSGPQGLKGDDILITARVIAVANAFVAMTSPRSWREAIDADTATRTLLEEVDKAYDRRVVAALINYLDNRGGRAELEQQRRAATG